MLAGNPAMKYQSSHAAAHLSVDDDFEVDAGKK